MTERRIIECLIQSDRVARFDVKLRDGREFRGAAIHGSGGIVQRTRDALGRVEAIIDRKRDGRDEFPNVRIYQRYDAHNSLCSVVHARDIETVREAL